MSVQDFEPVILADQEEPAAIGDQPLPLVALKPQSKAYVSYKRRWFILIVYSLGGLLQGYLWNMWGPIFKTMKVIYHWDNTQLALMPFYGNSVLAVLALPSALLLEKWGLRRIVVIMTFLIALGTLIRCIPAGHVVTNVLINISAVVNGVPGIVTFFLPAYISARWFPPNERKFATAFGILLNTIGCALAFVVGPFMVSLLK